MPAVFTRLARLAPGDTVLVDRADGSIATFRVTRRQQVAKVAFPTDDVYAPDLEPSLRLITCGGGFSAKASSTTGMANCGARKMSTMSIGSPIWASSRQTYSPWTCSPVICGLTGSTR